MADLAIFVHSGTEQDLHAVMGIAMTASIQGDDVLIALFNEGLAGWLSACEAGVPDFGRSPFAEVIEAGHGRLNIPRLPTLLADCREFARDSLEILACSGSMEILGRDPQPLIDAGWVDDVVGLPTIWRRAEDARFLSV